MNELLDPLLLARWQFGLTTIYHFLFVPLTIGLATTAAVFQTAEGDLHNRVPAVGEVNGDRSNLAYSLWARNPAPLYGNGHTIIDIKLKRIEPREGGRGRAARITLYMDQTYGLRVRNQDRKRMCAWAKTFPVDDWERERNARIVRWQGRGNPFVTDAGALGRRCG